MVPMPKSRGRRRKPHRTLSDVHRLDAGSSRARALAEFPILQATDAAEARGDARAALRIIERDQLRRGDENFWRPGKVERLGLLNALGPLLPRWATSRWILAQALQWLDQWSRARTARALEIAIAARGGEAALLGGDELDARVKVIDHDWVFRQTFLYELGGLQHFVSRVASADLLAGADGIHDWARTPMGAFRLVGESALSLTWSDLATDQEIESLNLGAASLLQPGECAIGRLVAVAEGAMFESAPLAVPDEVAQQVAEAPSEWVGIVSAACRERRWTDEPILTDHGHDFRLLTDVPLAMQQIVAVLAFERTTGRRAPLDSGAVLSVEHCLLRAALDDRLEDVLPGCSPFPSVAATLLDPLVIRRLRDVLAPSDSSKLERLGALLAGPASDLCLALARDLATAAV